MNQIQEKVEPHYSAFAEIYDQVMKDVDYPHWAKHVLRLAKKYNFEGKRWLDLACGTGSTSLQLIGHGLDMTGVDFSPRMLEKGREKAEKKKMNLPLFVGGMDRFEQEGLPRDFDVIICLYDSLNYLTEAEQVQSCFEQVSAHLRPGGGFIFDVTTEYNLIQNFAGYTFAENLDSASYIWENEYNIVNKLCRSRVTIFMNREAGRYEKTIENHDQRVYRLKDLLVWLEDAGFENLGQYKDQTMEPPSQKCERIHFVARKAD